MAPPGDTASTATLTMTWPQPASAEAERQGDELVLRFTRPVEYEAFAGLMPDLSHWLAGAFFGYDSMVLTVQQGTSQEVTNVAGRVVLRLVRSALGGRPASPVEPADPTHGDSTPPDAAGTTLTPAQRLRLLKAILYFSVGEYGDASLLLDDLERARPKDRSILSAQSAVQLKLGRWRLAGATTDRINALAGLTDRRGLPPTGSGLAPLVSVDLLAEDQAGQAQRLGLRAATRFLAADGLSVHLGYERAQVTLPANQALAAVADTSETSVDLAAAGLRYDGLSGSWANLTVSGTPDRQGGAAAAELWDRLGGTRLDLRWGEPQLGLPSLAALGATRDSAGLIRTFRSSSAIARGTSGDLSAHLAAHRERWRASRDATVLSDWVTSAGVAWQSWHTRPQLTLQYAFQLLTSPERDGTPAARSAGLSATIARSHYHSLGLSAHLPLWRWLGLWGQTSYGLGIGNADVLQASAQVGWIPPVGLRISLSYQFGATAQSYGLATTGMKASAGYSF